MSSITLREILIFYNETHFSHEKFSLVFKQELINF